MSDSMADFCCVSTKLHLCKVSLRLLSLGLSYHNGLKSKLEVWNDSDTTGENTNDTI